MSETLWICLNCGLADGGHCKRCGSDDVKSWTPEAELQEIGRQLLEASQHHDPKDRLRALDELVDGFVAEAP